MGKVLNKSTFSLLFLVLLSGCSLTRHYKKVATDADVTVAKKAIIAPWVATHFPVRVETVTKVDSFTTVIYDDETMSELNSIIDSLLITRDTAVKWLKENCVPRVERKTIRIRDTVFQTNGAQLFALQNQIALKESEITQQVEKVNRLEERVKKVKETRNYLIGVLALIGIAGIVFLLARLKPWSR
jgi:hypothetical protein